MVSPLYDEAVLGSPDLTDTDDSEVYVSEELLQTERTRALAEVEIDHLPSYNFNTDADLPHQISCVICMCGFEVEQMIRDLPCLHQFHMECIDAWLKSNASCPICRDDVTQYITDME
jgi:E3 ubiquitin-protein ligase RNF38/44